jgi:hypothetical protein
MQTLGLREFKYLFQDKYSNKDQGCQVWSVIAIIPATWEAEIRIV